MFPLWIKAQEFDCPVMLIGRPGSLVNQYRAMNKANPSIHAVIILCTPLWPEMSVNPGPEVHTVTPRLFQTVMSRHQAGAEKIKATGSIMPGALKVRDTRSAHVRYGYNMAHTCAMSIT